MSSREGFFEVQSDDNAALQTTLERHPAIEKTTLDNGKILAYPKQPLTASELNRYLFDRQIVLNHLVMRKNSLEEQFLELTKNHPSQH